MGATYATVDLLPLDGTGTPFSARFLVDTAIECLAPRDQLLAAGIKPVAKKRYELADGTMTELEYEFARAKLLGDETDTNVISGEPGVEPILGVLVMAAMGLVVDPQSQTLKRLKAIALKTVDPTQTPTG